MRLLQRLVLPLTALLLAGPAAASTLSFSLSFVNASGGTSTWNGSQAGTVSGTQETFVGQQVASGWALGWNVTADTDPFVNGFFSIQNNTAVTQTYSFTVTLPVAPPITPISTIGGSIGVTITDANGDGVATAASVGSGYVFNAANDGTTTLQLLPSFSLSAPFAGGSATASASAGLPGATISSIAANGTISITHTFTLTPGDSIGLTSFYQVSSVPEPGTLTLFAAGAAGLLAIGRRRSI
jgi:hypothetical protein